jgi:hypothetical protein
VGEPINYLTLTDTVIRETTLPPGKAQHYLHDDKLPSLAVSAILQKPIADERLIQSLRRP